jgi:RNA polymerase sigma-70 factor (ECF subfamily)
LIRNHVNREGREEIEESLLRRVAAKDQQALAELYDQTVGVLFSVAFRLLGNREEAEDVMQDVYVQIWNKAFQFDSALGTPIHWAMRITRNRAIDRLRRQGLQKRIKQELETEVVTVDAPAPSADLSETELGRVRGIIASLPHEQRQSIELAFFRGMTHQQIAEMLNQPLGTVKARIRRGMMALRENLQDFR